MMMREQIAEIFREERAARNLNYDAFGRLIGVTGRAVKYWEDGDRIPRDIEKINAALEKLDRKVVLGKKAGAKRS